jgi:hypothetical protein
MRVFDFEDTKPYIRESGWHAIMFSQLMFMAYLTLLTSNIF